MANPYIDGNYMWHWYNLGLPIVVAVLTLAALVAGLVATDRRVYGTAVRTLLILGFLGTLPLGLMRLGINFSANDDSLFVIGILGTLTSVIVGAFHFVVRGRLRAGPQTANAAGGTFAEGGVAEAPPGAGASAEETFAEPALEESSSTLDPSAAPAAGAATALAPEAPPAWLVFKSGTNSGQTIPVSSGVTSIGRAPESDVVIDDAGVSRLHAQITFADGQYQLTDVGSAGGTLVEGSAAAATVVLGSGSELQVGETQVVFMQGQPTAMPGPAGTAAGGGASATIMMEQPQEKLTAWLAVTAGPAKGETCQINVGETRIGRADDNHLRAADAGVSRYHAVVIANEKGITLLDLGSASGTTVNGKELRGAELTTTSVITLGGTELMLVGVQQSDGDAPIASAADATMIAGPAGAASAGVLVVQKGADAGKTFQMTDGDNVIGRDDAAVLLTDPSVSRHHAVVRKTGEKYVIYDLGSSSGTIVDGKKFQGTKVKGGDTIKLGRTELVVMQPAGQ